MATTPCSLFLSACACFFFFFKTHFACWAPCCNNHKANATLTTVWLHYNKIGDRGAVALAGALQALLATVFSCRPHSLFLRFGLDNVLPGETKKVQAVLRAGRAGEKPAFKHACAGGVLCTAGGQWFSIAVVSNEAAHVMSADQRYSCVNDGSPSPCVHAATAVVQGGQHQRQPVFYDCSKLARRNNPNTCACWKEILRPW